MAKKELGSKSLQQNDFLEPKAPTGVTATDIGTNRAFSSAAATVSFSLPGDSPAATSYTVTSSPGGLTGTGSGSPITVAGLTPATSYTFTVTATNASGTSPASAPSSAVTVTTVPNSVSVTATTGVNQDTISWAAPLTGGKAIIDYAWSSSDGKSGTTTLTSVNVAQEGNTAQTYTVTVRNANGSSLVSAPSNSVTTTPPFFPPSFPFFPPAFCPFFPNFCPFFPNFCPAFCPFFPNFCPSFCPFFPAFCPFFPSFCPAFCPFFPNFCPSFAPFFPYFTIPGAV